MVSQSHITVFASELDELKAIEVDYTPSAFPSGFDYVALFIVGRVDAYRCSFADGGAYGFPESVPDFGGDRSDIEPGGGFCEPSTDGSSNVIGDRGCGDDDHVGHARLPAGVECVVNACVDRAEIGVP